jgi:hypothetical protein
LNLAQSGATNQASFVGTADTLALNDVLGLLETVSGVEPFGPGLPDDALVLSNVRLSFESGDERSIELSATSTILDTVQTDVLLAFLTPQNGPSLLTLGMHVHQFRLRELYAGVNGTIAGELEFPDVAFTVVQEVPNPPTEPFTIPSSSLSPTAEDFYRALRGPTPFTLELNAGLNFAVQAARPCPGHLGHGPKRGGAGGRSAGLAARSIDRGWPGSPGQSPLAGHASFADSTSEGHPAMAERSRNTRANARV